MLRPARDFLYGRALPPAERPMAIAQAERLISDLEGHGAEVLVGHDLHWIAAAFRERGWHLSHVLDPRWWPLASVPEETIAVFLDYGSGPVGCSAMRWIWLDGTFREDQESRRFYFGDYADVAVPGERVRVTAPMGDVIGYCGVVYSCGYHLEETVQRPRDSWRIIRLAQLLAGLHWRWSWLVARVGRPMAWRFAEQAFGMTTIENGIHVLQPNGEVHVNHHLIVARIDHMRRQFQRPEYGDGEKSLTEGMPLLDRNGHIVSRVDRPPEVKAFGA